MPLLVLLDGPPGPNAPAFVMAADLTGDQRPDACGHGSRMLRLVDALARQGLGAVAIAHGTVLRADGTGDAATLARGLRWAARLHPDVVAVPLGLPGDHPGVRAAVADVLATGAGLLAAAGNPSAGQRGPLHPAALPGVVAVGAGDHAASYLLWDVPPDEVHDLPPSAAGSGTSGACVVAAWRRVVGAAGAVAAEEVGRGTHAPAELTGGRSCSPRRTGRRAGERPSTDQPRVSGSS